MSLQKNNSNSQTERKYETIDIPIVVIGVNKPAPTNKSNGRNKAKELSLLQE